MFCYGRQYYCLRAFAVCSSSNQFVSVKAVGSGSWVYSLVNEDGRYLISAVQERKDLATQRILLPPYCPAEIIFNDERDTAFIMFRRFPGANHNGSAKFVWTAPADMNSGRVSMAFAVIEVNCMDTERVLRPKNADHKNPAARRTCSRGKLRPHSHRNSSFYSAKFSPSQVLKRVEISIAFPDTFNPPVHLEAQGPVPKSATRHPPRTRRTPQLSGNPLLLSPEGFTLQQSVEADRPLLNAKNTTTPDVKLSHDSDPRIERAYVSKSIDQAEYVVSDTNSQLGQAAMHEVRSRMAPDFSNTSSRQTKTESPETGGDIRVVNNVSLSISSPVPANAVTSIAEYRDTDIKCDDSSDLEVEPLERSTVLEIANRILQNWQEKCKEALWANQNPAYKDMTSGEQSAVGRSTPIRHGQPSSSRSHHDNKRSQEDLSDDDETGEKPRKRRANNKNMSLANTNGRLWACPYYKYDANKYSERNTVELEYRGCASVYLRNISRLKQHLHRVHEAPQNYCGRCHTVFAERNTLDQHSRQLIPCNVSNPRFEERMTLDQVREINRKHPGLSDRPHWFKVWEILFPNMPPPESPYIDDAPQQHIQAFLGYWRREALPTITAGLEGAGLIPTNDLIRAATARVLDTVITQLIERYHITERRARETDLSTDVGHSSSTPASRSGEDLSQSSSHIIASNPPVTISLQALETQYIAPPDPLVTAHASTTPPPVQSILRPLPARNPSWGFPNGPYLNEGLDDYASHGIIPGVPPAFDMPDVPWNDDSQGWNWHSALLA